jgi:hypothetical protein
MAQSLIDINRWVSFGWVEGWGFKSTQAEYQTQCKTYQSENDADDAAAESLAVDGDRLLFDSARIESIDAWGSSTALDVGATMS